MSSHDPSRDSGRTATAVLLAVAVLAVIGSVFGYILGTRANELEARESNHPTPTPTSQVTTGQSPTGQQQGGEACPTFSQEAAQRRGAKLPLTLVLYIATESDKAEVWICRAADGRLWYQGHKVEKGRYPAETPVEGVNGLLLDVVNSPTPGEYLAINKDGTRYTVSRKLLEIRNGLDDDHPERQRVVESKPSQ